jgi:hypothetical protein
MPFGRVVLGCSDNRLVDPEKSSQLPAASRQRFGIGPLPSEQRWHRPTCQAKPAERDRLDVAEAGGCSLVVKCSFSVDRIICTGKPANRMERRARGGRQTRPGRPGTGRGRAPARPTSVLAPSPPQLCRRCTSISAQQTPCSRRPNKGLSQSHRSPGRRLFLSGTVWQLGNRRCSHAPTMVASCRRAVRFPSFFPQNRFSFCDLVEA